MTHYVVLVFFPFCMVMAMLWDITTMKIPNKLVLILLAGFAVFAPISGLGWSPILWHVSVAVVVLFIGFGIFAAGLLGAGDVKLLAATSLWLGPAATVPYLLYMGVLGGVTILLLLMWRQMPLPIALLKFEWIERLHRPKGDVPYGAALGPAALLVFTTSPLGEIAIRGISSSV